MLAAVSTTTSVLRALQDTTSPRCARLTRRLAIAPDADAATIARHLATFRLWMAPRNDHIWRRAWPADLEANVRLQKPAWLEADLANLGAPVQTLEALTLPNDPGWLFGTAYMIEGVMRGAPSIASRHVSLASLRYVEGYGAATGRMWCAFAAEAERSVTTDYARERATRAAHDAFDELVLAAGGEGLLD